MDPKEKAAYLIDRGYISKEASDAYFALADRFEAQEAESNNNIKTTHITSSSTIIDYLQEDFVSGINKIVQQIRDDKWVPDYIVGIVRGGAVPAIYLSHKLGVPVQMVRWNTRDTTLLGNESNCWLPEVINAGKKILIVDDIVDGGTTIQELLNDWNTSINGELNLDFIRIAAMAYNIRQPVKVNYCDLAIDRNVDKRWLVFPWEA